MAWDETLLVPIEQSKGFDESLLVPLPSAKSEELRKELARTKKLDKQARWLAEDRPLIPKLLRPPEDPGSIENVSRRILAQHEAPPPSPLLMGQSVIGQKPGETLIDPMAAKIARGASSFVRAQDEMIHEMSRPSMLPALAPLAIGGPYKKAVRGGMGLLFGDLVGSSGLGRLSVAIPEGDPEGIGTGLAEGALGLGLGLKPAVGIARGFKPYNVLPGPPKQISSALSPVFRRLEHKPQAPRPTDVPPAGPPSFTKPPPGFAADAQGMLVREPTVKPTEAPRGVEAKETTPASQVSLKPVFPLKPTEGQTGWLDQRGRAVLFDESTKKWKLAKTEVAKPDTPESFASSQSLGDKWDSSGAEEAFYEIMRAISGRKLRESRQLNTKATEESLYALEESIKSKGEPGDSFWDKWYGVRQLHRMADDASAEFGIELSGLGLNEAKAVTAETLGKLASYASNAGEGGHLDAISPNYFLSNHRAAFEKLASEIRAKAKTAYDDAAMDFASKRKAKEPQEAAGRPEVPLKIPKPPVQRSGKGLSQEQKDANFAEYSRALDKYDRALAKWEKAQPQNKPLIFDMGKPAGYHAITRDPEGGWRVTRFNQLWKGREDYAPIGHERHETRLQAISEAAHMGKLVGKLPRILDEAEIRKVTQKVKAEAAGVPAKKKKQPVQREPDLIDAILERVGKIRSRSIARPGEEGYYDSDYKELVRIGSPTLQLFTKNKERSQGWDEARDALVSLNLIPEDWVVSDLRSELLKVGERRKQAGKGELVEQQVREHETAKLEEFTDKAIEGKRSEGEPKTTQTLSVKSLAAGDKIEIAGVDFDVSKIVTDENNNPIEVKLDDGRRFGVQTVDGDAVITIDKGTHVENPEAVDFAPTEVEEAPFSLDKPETPEEAKARERAELARFQQKAEREAVEEGAAKPLTGSSADVGQQRLEIDPVQELELPSGPGTASPREFAERQKRARDLGIPPEGTDAPPVEPPNAPPEARVRERAKQYDILPLAEYVLPPHVLFRKLPQAREHASQILSAALTWKKAVRQTVDRFDALRTTLTKPEQIRVSSALKAAQKGDNGPLEALPHKLYMVANEFRRYFDEVRSVIIEGKRNDLIESLPKARSAAVKDILAGIPKAEAFKKNKLRAAGKKAVEDAFRELDELRTWGWDDYVTNIERGTWHIVTEDGTIIANAQTRGAASAKALNWLYDNPSYKGDLELTDDFIWPSHLKGSEYRKLVKSLREAGESDAKIIQQMLKREGRRIAVKMTRKFSGPMQKRFGVLKGEENLFDIIGTYAASVEKKLALDPVLKQSNKVLKTLPPNAKAAMEALIKSAKGMKHAGDQLADAILSPFGFRPFAYSRGVNVARDINLRLKLGYRLVTALVNRFGGLHHTWTKAGTKAVLGGSKMMRTPEFKEIWKENGHLVGDDPSAFLESGRFASPGGLWRPMGMFQMAEHINRPESFASFMWFAENTLGLDRPAAIRYAIDQSRTAQFIYAMEALPRLLRSPSGRLIGQFKSYLANEIPFVARLKGAEWARYLTGFMILGGPRAYLYLLKSIPVLGALGVWHAIENWLNEELPVASRGIGGAVGVDVTAPVTPQLPKQGSDWMGPTLADLSKLWTDIVKPALSGEDRDMKDVGRWLAGLAPAMLYWSRMVEAIFSDTGYITDKKGRPSYKPTDADILKMLAGAKPLKQSQAEVDRYWKIKTDQVTRANRTRVLDRLVSGERNPELLEKAAEYGITFDDLKSAAQRNALPANARVWKSLLKINRARMPMFDEEE